jgi:peptidoglycan/xylan/chitin deacetylase (PgdA/CDA1 family)
MKKVFFLFFLFSLGLSNHAWAEQKVSILVYHSIDEFSGHGLKGLYVTPENFEKQMLYLKDHGFTLLTFDRWQDRRKVNKPIFITIDDGYKNNLNAFTILQKLKSPSFQPTATIFAIADFVGRPNRLSAAELQKLAESGIISIQSHTATHPDLTKPTTDYEYQFKISKEKIEKITGKEVFALSYPFGKFNERVLEEVKKYYRYGLTDRPLIQTGKGDPNRNYLLPRQYIYYSTSIDEFAHLVEDETKR